MEGCFRNVCRLYSRLLFTPFNDVLKIYCCIYYIAHAAYFAVFEFAKRQLGVDRDGHHPLKAAACGATASVSHDIFMTPFDTIKQRMQIGRYRNMAHCISSMVRIEGPISLYLSFPTTFMMNIPYGCVMVAVNESMKKVTHKFHFLKSIK